MTFTYSRKKSHAYLTNEEVAQSRNDTEAYTDTSHDLASLLNMAMSDIHFDGDADLPFLYLPQILKGNTVLFDEVTLNAIYEDGRGLSGRRYDAYLAQVIRDNVL